MSATTALDVFAGVGWGVACNWLGIREYGVEIAPSAIRLRTANGMRTIYRDVWSGLFHPIELVPQHDLYIASPPCQTFSMAGKGDGRKALNDVLDAIARETYIYPGLLHHLTQTLDPRTALVLTPLAHIHRHRPRLVALEQVPEVLPIWNAYAAVLRSYGYSVWTGIMRAEQYGVPQTRKRAILMARRDGKVEPPTPTHSRYYSTDPGRLDPGVEKWVSMAEALGWGMTERPSVTVTGGSGRQGGPDPLDGGSGARKTLRKAQELGKWQGPGGVDPRVPATTVAADPRLTSRGHHNHGEQGRAVKSELVREHFEQWTMERPAPTVVATRRSAGGMLIGRQLADGSRQDVGGHSGVVGIKDGQLAGVRVTVEEAAALQSFPPDLVLLGTQSERHLAIGNAVPPLMAAAILGALLAPPAERDAWDHVFAGVAG
ncbi:DNA cytosine methyltransferase [Leucobacter sp. NPDC058333]|uniref:DNA cytosine methyltransferase n=1 Tax=Leucobacter sp. NPDC058333 TaxID=3346450 RepID=UPI0036689962